MKFALPLILSIAATPALAQDLRGQSVSVDLGLGGVVKPTYPGSDEHETSPWFILRNLRIGEGKTERDGFSLSGSFDLTGTRRMGDDDRLIGIHEIDRAVELGMKASYRMGAASAYASLRKGFGGHHGVVGEVGAKYRIDTSDKLTLWAGLEAGYGNDEYNETYFGISETDASRSSFSTYAPGGGFNSASASLEARYNVTPNTAILGEVKYSRLIGDAADSPIVLDESQPSVRLGIVRTLNFGF